MLLMMSVLEDWFHCSKHLCLIQKCAYSLEETKATNGVHAGRQLFPRKISGQVCETHRLQSH